MQDSKLWLIDTDSHDFVFNRRENNLWPSNIFKMIFPVSHDSKWVVVILKKLGKFEKWIFTTNCTVLQYLYKKVPGGQKRACLPQRCHRHFRVWLSGVNVNSQFDSAMSMAPQILTWGFCTNHKIEITCKNTSAYK